MAANVMAALLASSLILGGYYYIKHKGAVEAIEKIKRDSADEIELEKRKAEYAEQQKNLRVNNAIQTYVKRYDEMRAIADSAPKRVFIKSSSCVNAVSETSQDRSKAQDGIGGTGKAELQESNLRQLNQVIVQIEAMQLKCGLVLDQVE